MKAGCGRCEIFVKRDQKGATFWPWIRMINIGTILMNQTGKYSQNLINIKSREVIFP